MVAAVGPGSPRRSDCAPGPSWGSQTTSSGNRTSVMHTVPRGDPGTEKTARRMPELAANVPARRDERLIQPLGEEGRHVVKDPRSGVFFQLGAAEHFLLLQFDGRRTAGEIRAAFAEHFGEP